MWKGSSPAEASPPAPHARRRRRQDALQSPRPRAGRAGATSASSIAAARDLIGDLPRDRRHLCVRPEWPPPPLLLFAASPSEIWPWLARSLSPRRRCQGSARPPPAGLRRPLAVARSSPSRFRGRRPSLPLPAAAHGLYRLSHAQHRHRRLPPPAGVSIDSAWPVTPVRRPPCRRSSLLAGSGPTSPRRTVFAEVRVACARATATGSAPKVRGSRRSSGAVFGTSGLFGNWFWETDSRGAMTLGLRPWGAGLSAGCRRLIIEHIALIARYSSHFTNTGGLIHRKECSFPEKWLNGDNPGDSVRVNSGFPVFVADLAYSRFTRFTNIINSLKALGKDFPQSDLVRKLLRVLPRSWIPKVTAIQEAHDLDKVKIDELVGSLMAHEQRLKEYDNEAAPEKKKSLALKGVIASESEDGEEGSSEEIAMISKRLDRLIKKHNLRRPKRDGFKGEGFKKGIICYNCNKPGHLKSECTLPNKTFKKDKKNKAFNALNWDAPTNLAMMNRKTK
uniref:CCHC-type domain-containing protein n=1 Tax=Ananas comosus var. bracteatus TaxID=296719 RepID=A0A6V7NTB2_ANACO|nr:unnamed protein product [Ananas comosus var. bracteatus]